MEARIRWIENAAFMAATGSGHALVVDGPKDIGGRNLGPRPMELMLISTGACASMDMIEIMKKARQSVTACEVRLIGTRAETIPKAWTAIHLHFIVTGTRLAENTVQRAVQLSVEKYCSALSSLAPSVKISHDYEMVTAGVD